MKRQKVIIFQGIIDSLDAFAQQLCLGFTEAGCDCLMIDVNDLRYVEDPAFEKIKEYTQDKSTFAVFLNNIGMLLEGPFGGNYWNQSGIRCFDILADPPFFYDKAIQSDIEQVTFLCVDEDQADYINRYYGPGSAYERNTGRTRHALFMPLAGIQARTPNRAYHERQMGVVFTGNLRDYRDIDPQLDGLDDSLLQLWELVYEQILENPGLTIESSIRVCMKQHHLRLNDDHVLQIILLFKRMDSILRARFREKTVRTLVDNGIQVHVFGNGWENLKTRHKENLIVHGLVSYDESVELMQNTKLSLNIMPWFKRGFHDRIATAALNGCVSITDTSTYINQNYIDGKDLVCYDLRHGKELCSKVAYLLSHDSEAEKIAENAQNTAQKDTWKQRANWILQVANQRKE